MGLGGIEVPDDGRARANERRVFGAPLLDAPDLAHAVVEGAFALTMPDPQARAALRVRAISRAKYEAVSWYLWTDTCPGAFELALLPTPDAEACLALRYFPDPPEPDFVRFASIEQATRRSAAFDATGTPAFAHAHEIEPSLFHVGTLAIAQRGDRVALTLVAQDRWIEEVVVDEVSSLQRDVPGLALSLAALDPLACALAYLGRSGPARVDIERTPGTRWCLTADGLATPLADEASTAWRISIDDFALPGRASADAAATLAPDDVASFPPASRWHEAARWRFAPVGSFCAHCAEPPTPHFRHAPRVLHHGQRNDGH